MLNGVHQAALGDLNSRSKAALATIIGDQLRNELVQSGRGVKEAEATVAAMKVWVAGGDAPADRLNDLVIDEDGHGVAIFARENEPNFPAWNALTSALCYVTYYAYLAQGERPSPEVTEETLAHAFEEWRKTSSFDEDLWHRAIALLRKRQREIGDAPIDVDRILAELNKAER